VIYSDVRHDIGGDEQRVHNISTDFSDITFKHLLLPVYAGAYRFNARTYPYSWLKIAALVAFILFVILTLAAVFGGR
jgi:hypothetical protein